MAIMLATSFTLAAYGQAKADKKLSRDYEISKGFTLGIENTYGDINIVNWDEDALSVVVTVEVEATSQSKADKLLESVNIEIDESSNSVFFETEFEKQNYNEKKKIRITYDVKTPAYMNVELEQAYGNVYIQELTGTADLEIKYSSLTADALMVEDNDEWNSLELKYGDATIGKVNGLDA